MKFKEFMTISETGTSTADVAHFSRPILPLVRRVPKKGENKEYRVPQVYENQDNPERASAS
jgi:hypothetical protein